MLHVAATTAASAPEQDTCQLCLENEDIEPLIKSCNCRLVHRSCLQKWRVHCQHDSAFHACEVCRFQYEFQDKEPSTVWDQRKRTAILWASLSWDLITTILVIEAGSCLAAFCFYLFDHGDNVMADALSKQHHMLAYWLWGHVGFFFVTGLVTMIGALICGSSGGNSSNFYCINFFGGGDCDCGRDCNIAVLGFIFVLIVLIGWAVAMWTACEWISKRWTSKVRASRRWVEAREQVVVDQRTRMV